MSEVWVDGLPARGQEALVVAGGWNPRGRVVDIVPGVGLSLLVPPKPAVVHRGQKFGEDRPERTIFFPWHAIDRITAV